MLIIAPEKSLLKKIVDALSLIKKIDFDEYQNLFSRINVIFITRRVCGSNGFCMPEKYWFTNKTKRIRCDDLIWVASALLHEGFHATQFKNGKYILPMGEAIEKPAIEFEIKFLEKVGYQKGIDKLRRYFREKEWVRMDEDTISDAHFENLLKLLKKDKLELVYVDLAS